MHRKFKTMKKQHSFKSIAAIACTGLWMLCPHKTNAQLYPQPQEANLTPDKQELSITVGGLYATLDYDMPQTKIKDGQGFSAGIEYTYYFANNFGVSVGAEYQRSGATANTETISEAYQTTDYEDESFEYRYTMSKITEKQTMGFVNIPLLVVYQNQQYGFYIKAGAKVGLPISSKFNASYLLNASGYYQQYNGELFDPAFMGFGDLGRINAGGNNIDTKPSYILSFELGAKQPMNIGNLYAGVFIDYGINNMIQQGKHPIVYNTNNSGVDFNYNSLLNSNYADNLKTLAIGIKIRYAFWKF